MSAPAYDQIGLGYQDVRQPEPRIAARIEAALGDARTVLNVGAGSGSYEPPERQVTAVEPSSAMIEQRPSGAAPVIQASAEALPLPDKSFDAAMAVLTIHHWQNLPVGLSELVRVTRQRIVLLTIDADVLADMWLVRDYFPEAQAVHAAAMPSLEMLVAALPNARAEILPVPRGCRDGFFAAPWDRPEAHLETSSIRKSRVSSWIRQGRETCAVFGSLIRGPLPSPRPV